MEESPSRNAPAAHLSLNELAAATLREQADIFARKKEAAAREEDEAKRSHALHDARVALRRLRIVGSRKLRKRVDRLDRALSRARDADVTAADAAGYAEKLSPGRKARFDDYLQDLRAERDREFRMMATALEGKDAAKAAARALREAKRREREVAAALPRPAGLDAGSVVAKAYAALAAFEAPAIGGAPDEALYHDIRRAAKRFRFTLELFEPILGPGCAELVAAAKALQDYLGGINDAAVCARSANEHLARWAENPDGPLHRAFPEVAAYLAARLKRVQKGAAAFPREWRRVASAPFRKRLHAVLGACPIDFLPAARYLDGPGDARDVAETDALGRSGG